MNKFAKIASMSLLILLAFASISYGQTGGGTTFSGAFGAGLVTIGAAYGISRLAAAALESMARQPESAGSIQTAMIIAAALIEGFTFYAIWVCSTQNPWA